MAGVHPTLRPVDCTFEQLAKLAMAAIAVSRQSYQTHGITNDLDIVATLKQQGYPRRAYRHFAFNRDGQPCFVCGTEILKVTLAGRRLYYRPKCQSR